MEKRAPQVIRSTVAGGDVSVRFWPGKGRPLVLLHGFLDSSEGWDNLCRHTHRPCYAFDLPGFGHSDIPSEATFSAYGQRIALAAQQLQIGPAIWVAHSMGGAVARAISDDPTLNNDIISLALITPAGFGTVPLASVMDNVWLKPLVIGAFPLVSANPLSTLLAYPSQISGGRRASGPLMWRTMKSALRGPQGPAMAAHALSTLNHLSPQDLYAPSAYAGPVASLWGEKDRLIPASHAAGVQAVYPQASVTLWEELAHHPQAEQPRKLQSWIDHVAARSRR
jgi:pimeloyl-ACP methyl ester carboxylesterase